MKKALVYCIYVYSIKILLHNETCIRDRSHDSERNFHANYLGTTNEVDALSLSIIW